MYYINSGVPSNHKCLACNSMFTKTPSPLLKSPTCPICREREKIKGYKKRIEHAAPDLSCLANNFDNNKLLVKCNNCSFKWLANPSNIIHNGSSCPKCYRNKIKSTIGDFSDYLNYKRLVYNITRKQEIVSLPNSSKREERLKTIGRCGT